MVENSSCRWLQCLFPVLRVAPKHTAHRDFVDTDNRGDVSEGLPGGLFFDPLNRPGRKPELGVNLGVNRHEGVLTLHAPIPLPVQVDEHLLAVDWKVNDTDGAVSKLIQLPVFTAWARRWLQRHYCMSNVVLSVVVHSNRVNAAKVERLHSTVLVGFVHWCNDSHKAHPTVATLGKEVVALGQHNLFEGAALAMQERIWKLHPDLSVELYGQLLFFVAESQSLRVLQVWTHPAGAYLRFWPSVGLDHVQAFWRVKPQLDQRKSALPSTFLFGLLHPDGADHFLRRPRKANPFTELAPGDAVRLGEPMVNGIALPGTATVGGILSSKPVFQRIDGKHEIAAPVHVTRAVVAPLSGLHYLQLNANGSQARNQVFVDVWKRGESLPSSVRYNGDVRLRQSPGDDENRDGAGLPTPATRPDLFKLFHTSVGLW